MRVTRPRILSISLSPIYRDARVLRQLAVLAKHGEVTSLGWGPKPDVVDHHVQIDDAALSLPQTPTGVLKLAAHRLRSAELDAPAVQQALEKLRGQTFDLVVSNDARTLALAFAVAKGAPVWADMHEWAPDQRSQYFVWRHMVKPLMDYMCREYLPQAAAVSTVNQSLVEKYREAYGIDSVVVRNARPFIELAPTPVPADGSLRLVHSGGAEPNRNLTMLIDATRELPHATLDLYLVTGGDPKYLDTLKTHAEGDERIRFRDPVAPADLPATLNQYDVGVFSLPPDNFNMEFCLPNKLFDFLQARLAMAVSPSPEMAAFVRDNHLGVVSTDYTKDSFVAALKTLTSENVEQFKASADAHAQSLSSASDVAAMDDIITRLLAR